MTTWTGVLLGFELEAVGEERHALTAHGGVQLPRTYQAILAQLVQSDMVQRRDIAHAVGVSLPTVSTALNELQAQGLVDTAGVKQGRLGRAATLYHLGQRAGWVLGLDVGTTHVDLSARTLLGRELARDGYEPGSSHAPSEDELMEQAGALVKRVLQLRRANGPLRAIAIAVSRAVPADLQSTTPLAAAAAGTVRRFVENARPPADVPLFFENNVNCSALAEHTSGAATGYSDVAYLQVGVNVGLGAITRGRLLRGANGAGGEVARIPFPWVPEVSAAGIESGPDLEPFLSSRGLLARAREAWNDESSPPGTLHELFEKAAGDDRTARLVVEGHGRDIGRLAAVIAAILDPAVVVLGGAMAQDPLLLRSTQDEFAKWNAETALIESRLGPHATLDGAVQLATDQALNGLLGEHHTPAVEEPSLVYTRNIAERGSAQVRRDT